MYLLLDIILATCTCRHQEVGSPVFVVFFGWRVMVVTLDPEDIKVYYSCPFTLFFLRSYSLCRISCNNQRTTSLNPLCGSLGTCLEKGMISFGNLFDLFLCVLMMGSCRVWGQLWKRCKSVAY